MDANNSRYHLLLGERDWAPLVAAAGHGDVAWDPDAASVGLAVRLPRIVRGDEPPLLPEDRRGAAADRWGTWYWIDDDEDHDERRIRVAPNADPRVGTFWSTDRLQASAPQAGGDFKPVGGEPAAPPVVLRGLTVTTHHYLVVGTLEPAGLLVFDLHGGGAPVPLCWPEEIGFLPFDLAPAADGGVWILDRDATGAGRYWKLDRHFRLVDLGGQVELTPEREGDFKPVGGEPKLQPAALFPAGVDLSFSSPVDAEAPVAILELPDGSVLLLDNPPGLPFSIVHRHVDGAPAGEPVPLDGTLASILDPASPAAGPDLVAHDFAFLPATEAARGAPRPPGTIAGALLLAAADSDQSFAFALAVDEDDRLTLDVCPRYLPMRHYGGKALVAACGDVYYDFGELWLPLTEHPRRRFEPHGEIEGIVFDGKLPGCRWHRLLLDGCIPDGAAVSVASRAADELELIEQTDWREEPLPYLRAGGSELPFHRPFSDRHLERDGTGTWELLLQRAEGRYLELRLTLASDGRSTPRLRALRVYYPRFSYLRRYLPAIYRADPESASFLDRFLANAEGLLTESEDEIAAFQTVLDVRTAPPEYLDWLAGWLGADLDATWDDARRRLFLAHAPLLFRWRGTARGLLATLRLHLDPCPEESIFDGLQTGVEATAAFADVRLVESWQARGVPRVVLGDPTALDGPGRGGGGEPWQPAMGGTALHLRYADFLRARYAEGEVSDEPTAEQEAAALAALNEALSAGYAAFSQIRFSPVLPANPASAADWRAFTDAGLTFPYAEVTAADTPLYREFLAQRYGGQVSRLNDAWRLNADLAWPSFDAVPLPAEGGFPESGPRLADWIDFASLFLPIRAAAHRFTVLVPTEPGEDLALRDLRLARVRDLVEKEKPTHTSFEVKPYWALFQVGGARLGIDTVLGEGSRFVAVVLGSAYLSESFLAESHPWNVEDRSVLGRDTPLEM